VNKAREEKAFFQVQAYLHQLRHQGIGVRGYTHSSLRPAVYHGYWWPEDGDLPVRDAIIVCTIDYLLDIDSQEISKKVKELKQTIRRWYRHYKSPQDEIWVIAHPILRQD
jgi:hypothetical protein